jgi:cellobiose-specific phosphotransferase system component IIB
LGKILEALSLTQANGDLPLHALIETQVKHMVRGSTVVLVTPSTSREVAVMLDFLIQRGLKPILVLIDSASFGGPPGTEQLAAGINLLSVPYRLVKNEMDLSTALSDGYFRG